MKWLRKVGRALITVLAIAGAVVGLGWLWGRRKHVAAGGEVDAAQPRADSLKQQMDDAMQKADTAADLRVEIDKDINDVDVKIEEVKTKLPPPTPQGVADAFNKRARDRKRDG